MKRELRRPAQTSTSGEKFGFAVGAETGGKLLEKFLEGHINFRQKRDGGGERRCRDLKAAAVCRHLISLIEYKYFKVSESC